MRQGAIHRATWGAAILLAVCLCGGHGTLGQVVPGGDAQPDINIFPPVPREYRLALGRAEKAIQQEDYATAVDELTRILNGEDPNDYFLGKPGANDAQTSLKTQALRMIGALPAKGKRQYELMCGHDARAMLDRALEEGDVAALTEVARRYFHTQAGYEAAILLGRLQLDQGRPLAAALQFQRVAEVESAAAQFDPELSVLLATSWLHAQQRDKAVEVLQALKQRLPKARVRTGGQEVPLFDDPSSALTWLEKLVGGGGAARQFAATQWVMFRGNETRNASTQASLPLLNYRWSLPPLGDPLDQQRVRQAAKRRDEQQEPLVPAVQPLVVRDYVIFRTPDHVVGAELESGKRIWIFPWDESASERVSGSGSGGSRSPAVITREQELQQRLFQDHAFGQLSSDGEQVFLIDEIGLAPVPNQNSPPRIILGPGGRNMQNNLWSRPFNKLVSLDIKRQGALRWIVGGETGMEEPKLAGAFFLGPPLPLGGQLFVLAEFNGEIRLVVLKASTGALEWQQSLATMTELQPVTVDRLRRLAGATPSFANGLLVCPTSGGGIVAVDVATRTLRWGYQYPRTDVVYFRQGFPFQVQRSNETGSVSQWIDSSLTIAEGCVLATPPESDKLHCLDLLTGTAKWEPQPRGDLLYVACVHEGKAILVGRNEVKAIGVAAGQWAWGEPVDLAGETPTGRGYYSDHFYYLPISSGELLKIDLNAGEIAARVKTEVALGNLVCYEGNLLSQSADLVAAFYLADPLRKRIDDLLAKNDRDAWALARKGEILLQDGKAREAVAHLRRAHELRPDEGTKSMLVRVILALLREEYASHADLADEAALLVADQPGLARQLQRLKADAMYKSGRHWEAFENYLALGRSGPADAEPMKELDRNHVARRDRWAAGRLAALFEAADEATRGKMTAEIQSLLEAARQANSADALREFATLFYFHPLAAEACVELASVLCESDQLLEAELLAGSVAGRSDRVVAGRATAILAAVYEKAGRPDLAIDRYRELSERFAEVACRGERTGKQLAEEAFGRQELAALLAGDAWPDGRAEIKVGQTEPLRSRTGLGEPRSAVAIADFRGAASRGTRVSYSQPEQAIQVRNDFGRLVSSVSLARLGNAATVYYNVPGSGATGRFNGNLLVVGLAGELVAIDALRQGGADGVLWRQEAVEADPTGRQVIISTQQRQVFNPLVGGSRMIVYGNSRYAVNFGPVTRLGVCFQRHRQLICADPLTGKTVWERTLLAANCEIFGDEEKIVIVPQSPGAGREDARDAIILSPVDGEMLDRRKIDAADRCWTTCGRNVLVWETVGGTHKLLLYDASNQGMGLWRDDSIPQGSRGCLIDGQELALLKPGGDLVIVSLRDGRELIRRKLPQFPGDGELESLLVMRSHEQYLVFVNQQPTPAERVTFNADSSYRTGTAITPVHGRLFALDRATGKDLWPTPAFISQQSLSTDHPSRSPVLFFVRNTSRTRRGTSRALSTSVLALDKRDGRVLYYDEGFLSQVLNVDVLVEPRQREVILHLASYNESRTLTIKLTDEPAPPQPPAQTGYLSSLAVGELPGTVDQSVHAAVELMQRAGRAPANLPGAAPLPARNLRGILPGILPSNRPPGGR
jgi:outer membrane protein assembly factor BamB